MEGPCIESVTRNCLGNLLFLNQWIRRLLPYVVCQFLICQKKVRGRTEMCFFFILFFLQALVSGTVGIRLEKGKWVGAESQGVTHCPVLLVGVDWRTWAPALPRLFLPGRLSLSPFAALQGLRTLVHPALYASGPFPDWTLRGELSLCILYLTQNRE